MANKIQLRRDQSAVWAAVNPVLAEGELGFEQDTRYAKIGDGVTPWNELGYLSCPTPGGGGSPPSNTGLPAISGTPTEGQTLNVSNGSWTGSPTGYARQWLRNGAAIAGATGAAYTLLTADVGATISCSVTASNAAGSASATSAGVGPVAAAPVAAPTNTGLPAITGTAQAGQTLSVSNGTWTGSPTVYARQWLRGGVAIAGATGATYTLVTADVGATISCTVNASNAGGSASATSAGVGPVAAAPVAAPTNTTLPAITGTAQVGQVLTVSNGAWTGSPTAYTRQWLRGGVAISGATGATYTLVTADLGAVISCTVTATNAGGSASATSAATAAVSAAAADSRARYGVGAATAGVSSPAALLAAMTVMTGAANASKAGSFTVSPTAGQYGWAAFEAGVSAAGVTFTDPLGTGGWQGASSAGNNAADDGSSPNTSTVTYTDSATGLTWRFFRQNYAAAAGSFTTS